MRITGDASNYSSVNSIERAIARRFHYLAADGSAAYARAVPLEHGSIRFDMLSCVI